MIEQGIEQGREQGLVEGIRIAKQVILLYGDGKSAETIAKETGISIEEVESILAE